MSETDQGIMLAVYLFSAVVLTLAAFAVFIAVRGLAEWWRERQLGKPKHWKDLP